MLGGEKIVVVADDRNAERALKTSLHKWLAPIR